nr:methyltransferase domain-containing protein [Aquisalimonas sp.]
MSSTEEDTGEAPRTPEDREVSSAVATHYAVPDLGDRILAALQAAGKDTTCLAPQDLAPIDEFHVRGREATLELAQTVGLQSTDYALDVGSGIGGTARCLAQEFGCRVTGVDLTAEYCRVAAMLAARTGLTDRVDYRQADANDLPFPDGAFSVVWTEHVAMNIPDKQRFYREMHRVLTPGGRLAIYDVLAGPSGPVHFPVPWARTSATSFLVSPEQLRDLLAKAGFTLVQWSDRTAAARAWLTELGKRLREEGPPVLGFHLLLGPEFETMARNQKLSLEEGRMVLAQVVARKKTSPP